MKVGLIGTGAIAHKHAQAYKNIGFEVVVCTNRNHEKGRQFATQYGAEYVESYVEVCRHSAVDFIDVCTFPDFRMPPLELCAESGKHILVQKPIATDLETARRLIDRAKEAGIVLGVVSQHRFDDASLFLSSAIAAGRLGRLLECDCYVKWNRSKEYYSRPGKGTWQVEGGGALINQAIHQVDLLRWMCGPVDEVFGNWQLGATHRIESEDIVNALVHYSNGATGVIQASTSFWPGYEERIEIHGSKGTAILSGDRLTTWDVQGDDSGEPPPFSEDKPSGSSDPMAISLQPFERQFLDFSDAIQQGRRPLIAGKDGYEALEIVEAIYRSCRTGRKVLLRGMGVFE